MSDWNKTIQSEEFKALRPPMQANPEALEALAEEIWRAEYRRAASKERNIPWSEVSPADQDKYRFVATAAIAAMPADPRVAELKAALERLAGMWDGEIDCGEDCYSDGRAVALAEVNQIARTALSAKPSPGCEHKAVAGPCSICGDMG